MKIPLNKFKKLWLLILISIVLESCTNDSIIIETLVQEESTIIQEISYDDLLENQKIVTKLKEFKAFNSENALKNNKSDDDDYKIDFKKIKHVKKGDFETYNFYIKRKKPKDKKVENLYLRRTDQGEFDAYLVKYNFTADEFETITKEQLDKGGTKFKKITKKLNLTSNKNTTGEGYWLCVEYWEMHKRPTHNGDLVGISGDPNSFDHYEWVWVLMRSECHFMQDDNGGGGSGTGSTDGSTGEPDFGGGGGSSSSTTETTVIYAVPVVPGVLESLHLTAEQDQYLVDNLNERVALERFLETDKLENGGTISHKALDFAYLAIDAWIDGGDVDFLNMVIIKKSFKDEPCLFNTYVKAGNTPQFNAYLSNFDSDFSVAHLSLEAGTDLFNVNANAETYSPKNYIIKVLFNTNKLQRPTLDIVRTMIHELIHAEMYRKLLSLANQGTIPWSKSFINNIKNHYPGLHDYYMRYKYNNPNGLFTSVQHQAMAQHYRGIIIQVLKEYDDSQLDEVYEALAWTGLKNTVAYSNLSQEQKDNISFYRDYFFNTNANCQ